MKLLLFVLALALGLGTIAAAAAPPTPAPVVYINQRLNVLPAISPGSNPPPHAGTVVFVYLPSPSNVPDVALTAWSPTGATEFYDHVQPCSTHAAPCWLLPDGP